MATTIPGTELFTGGAFELPDPGEDGLSWALVLEDFIRRLATHTHNGVSSADIVININKIEQLSPTIIPAMTFSETLPNSGVFISTDIPIPGGALITSLRRFYYLDGPDYTEFYPTNIYVSAGIYRIQTNQPIGNFKVLYY